MISSSRLLENRATRFKFLRFWSHELQLFTIVEIEINSKVDLLKKIVAIRIL